MRLYGQAVPPTPSFLAPTAPSREHATCSTTNLVAQVELDEVNAPDVEQHERLVVVALGDLGQLAPVVDALQKLLLKAATNSLLDES